jgi:FkbM family methyltransferase
MKRLEYEPELAFLARLIQPGDVLLDIGANVGIYALVCAKRAGAIGRVYAFEPGAEALHALRGNCALNPDLNVEVLPMGLSDSVRSSRLFHLGGPTTFNLSASGAATGELVELTTLDAWIAGAGVSRIDVIKIDVEGHEPAVFAGGRNTLLSTRPLVMFEVSSDALARGGYQRNASWQSLVEHGYEMHRLEGGRLTRLTEVEDGNLFAVHPRSEWPTRLRNCESSASARACPNSRSWQLVGEPDSSAQGTTPGGR